MYEYIGGLIRSRKGHLVQIGGVEDHIHILTGLSPTLAVSDVLRELKASSSAWINETFSPQNKFQWQKGYGEFSVSCSNYDQVTEYIKNQEEHHKKLTFHEEFVELLKRHNIEFELKYLFEGEHHG